jgi:MoaA/NifB/PqqE/SkfB family radical SAM enzyme
MKKIVYQQLTKSCNLKCVMCSFYENKFENLPISYFKKMIDLYKKSWINTITFWWWEPFLYNWIYDLIKYSKDNWFNVWVITNWTILNKKSLLSVIKSLDKVFISLDSWLEETHDTIRWEKWVFKLAIDFIKYLNDIKYLNNKLEVNIDTTIQSINYSDFDTIIDIALKYNSKINFDPVQLNWYWNNWDISLMPNPHQVKEIRLKLLTLKEKYPENVIQWKESLNIIFDYLNWVIINKKCDSINKDLLVDPSWNVNECWGSNKIIYNVLEKWIKDITLKMWNKCDNCWFSHVREESYYEWY